MPLFSKKNTKGIDYKARLEHKLYLARETPEPLFDLSDCALKVVPSGIYSLCKVFRKEVLYLQENMLASLAGGGNLNDLSSLHILDLHSNCLTRLPDEIQLLKNLRVLNVSCNKLKVLPEAVGGLENLQLLNASENALRDLPSALQHLHCLERLDVHGNPGLSRLPAALGRLPRLQEMILDTEQLVHPPSDVVQEGTEAILRFLAAESGVEFESVRDGPDEGSAPGCSAPFPLANLEQNERGFQARIYQLERLKEQKQQERLTLERELEEHFSKELGLQDAMRRSKGRFLEVLAEQQSRLEGAILRVQQDRETERHRLVQQLQQVENAADCVISQLLAISANERDFTQTQILSDQERLEEERMLNVRQEEYHSLRHKEILKAMEDLLKEEGRRAEKLREYEEDRAETTRTLLSQETEENRQLAELLSHQEKVQSELVGHLQRDEQLQRAAVAALLERGDARSWGLVQQVVLVETQLAALTAVEMERKKLQLSEQVMELKEKRQALSALLMELLSQQATRRKELMLTLNRMEQQRQDRMEQQGNDYWLLQYQRLLDSRSGALMEMERALDPALAQHLVLAGVIHWLPVLAQWLTQPEQLVELTDTQLEEAGVSSVETREAILEAVKLYLEERDQRGKLQEKVEGPQPPQATAPPQTEVSSLGKAECVVCMEQECNMIFIPCGHMCCCAKCSDRLAECPMCRGDIERKVRVIVP